VPGELLEAKLAIDEAGALGPSVHLRCGLKPIAPRLLGLRAHPRLLGQQDLAFAVEKLGAAVGDVEAAEQPCPSGPTGGNP